MSLTKNRKIRCDWCGKLTGNENGEYTRPDGTAAYIVQPEWERFPGGDPTHESLSTGNDICEECAGGHCPACGSEAVINVTPGSPGPLGWVGRCRACGHQWEMPANP